MNNTNLTTEELERQAYAEGNAMLADTLAQLVDAEHKTNRALMKIRQIVNQWRYDGLDDMRAISRVADVVDYL